MFDTKIIIAKVCKIRKLLLRKFVRYTKIIIEKVCWVRKLLLRHKLTHETDVDFALNMLKNNDVLPDESEQVIDYFEDNWIERPQNWSRHRATQFPLKWWNYLWIFGMTNFRQYEFSLPNNFLRLIFGFEFSAEEFSHDEFF